MDREDLMDILHAYSDGRLRVCPDGTLLHTDRYTKCTPDEIEEAFAELSEKFRNVIAWAKSAPDYTQAEHPAAN